MATSGYALTYGETARRESLLDVLTNVDPTEGRLLKNLQKSTAYNTLHEWPIDTLEAVGANSQPEGADAPTDGGTDPSRANNITQIFAKTAIVTGTEQAVRHAGFSDRMAYEIMKKMKALNNDIEFALVRGSVASGVASVAGASGRRLAGMKNLITTNTSNYSGVSLTETIFNDILAAAWNQGGNINTVLTTMGGKRRVSAFTAGNTKEVAATDNLLVNSINVYQSDAAGSVKIFAHRYVTVSGDYGTTATPGYDLLAIQDDTWAVAFLQGREPQTVDLARTGDAIKKEIITELTLEARAQKANVYAKVLF
jgi:hypothetical protein